MHLSGIARYPIKGFSGEDLTSTALTRDHGVPGDRRFAFGVDASRDDGTWYSSRNYLINSRKDNLLKFAFRRTQGGWEITSPSGQELNFDPDDADSIKYLNGQLDRFFDCVESDGKTPCLIDRNPDRGPKGHWDFPDTELLIVNLATVRELERHWGIKIDPRRFRANLLIDGLPAWAEFGLYGAEFGLGAAKLSILRPARRCPAISVDPTTGERDLALQNDLVDDFGHGFFGVYARVTQSGDIVVGDDLQRTNGSALAISEMTCEIAPSITLWPKAALVESTDVPDTFEFTSIGSLALAEAGTFGRMKVHLKPDVTLNAEIVHASSECLTLRIARGAAFNASSNVVLLSGPFTIRDV
ncbi:MAG TPA: hypothetical protein DE314_01915 [Sulfitobacter sp.]|jgi:uncharacterized protein YcbX|nr:hypothetical protein [Sulfitobacter sp.]